MPPLTFRVIAPNLRDRPDFEPIKNPYNITVQNQFRILQVETLLFIAASGILAQFLIPASDFFTPGALMLPATVLALGLVAGPLISAIKHPASLLRAESVLSVGLIYWILIDAIQGSYGLWGTSETAIQKAFLGITIFAMGLWVGSILTTQVRGQLSTTHWPDVSTRFLYRAGLLTFTAGMLEPLLACNLNPACIVQSFFLPWYEVPWRIVDFGSFDTLLRYIGFLGFLTLPIAAALLQQEGRLTKRVVIISLLGAILVLILMQTGARRKVGLVVAATGLVWILLQSRIRFNHLFKLAMLSVALLAMLEVVHAWRDEGLATALFSESETEEVVQEEGVISIDKNLHYMSHAMTVVPQYRPYKPMDALLAMIGSPIPRSIWPDKPAQGGDLPLPMLIGERKAPGFSWSCSIVCDFYLMGGIVVIAIGGLFFGFLAQLVNSLLYQPVSVPSRVIYAFALMSLFIGLRNGRDLIAIGLIVVLIWGLFYSRHIYAQRSQSAAKATAKH